MALFGLAGSLLAAWAWRERTVALPLRPAKSFEQGDHSGITREARRSENHLLPRHRKKIKPFAANSKAP
jgi:hypothetical protein